MTTDLKTLKATAQATADKSPDLLVTVPAGVMLELIKDAERFCYIERDADSGMSKIYGDDWVSVIDDNIAKEAQ